MSRYLTSKHKNMEDDTESIVIIIKRLLRQVENMLTENYDKWEDYLLAVRSAIASLDRINFFRMTERLAEQRQIIQVLQDYAYHDADNGSIQEIADWCQASWLRILRDHPKDVETLTGLGHNWLQGSQASLARIHREEGSGSSFDSTQEAAAAAAAQRAQGPLYVEARGYLQPAIDFFSRAVSAADESETLTGELLALTAEAHMSLGNVSSAAAGEELFTQAIRYLRRARAIPGYTLPVYFQDYLEDYGRFVT